MDQFKEGYEAGWKNASHYYFSFVGSVLAKQKEKGMTQSEMIKVVQPIATILDMLEKMEDQPKVPPPSNA